MALSDDVDCKMIVDALKEHRIFHALEDHELQEMCRDACYVNFRQGELLIKEEKPNHYLYLVLEGKIHIKSYGIKIRAIHKGGLIGEISAAGLGSVTENSATAEAVAATDVKVVRFPVSRVHEFANEKQEFADTLHDVAMSRLLS